MKVFISWSGPLSHKVAIAFRDWLPSVIQSIEPYVSSEDIDKGARWSTDISQELEGSNFGILCVTEENLDAPWLNFEAGALSKSFEKSRVSPFLFGIKRSEVKGPLLQFQSTIFEKSDVLKLLQSINEALGDDSLAEERLAKVFDVWWDELEEVLKTLLKNSKSEQSSSEEDEDKSDDSAILEEVLTLVRQQQIILNNPERLLPPDYVEYATRNAARYGISPRVWRDLTRAYEDLWSTANSVEDGHMLDSELIQELIRKLERPLNYVLRRISPESRSLRSRRELNLFENDES